MKTTRSCIVLAAIAGLAIAGCSSSTSGGGGGAPATYSISGHVTGASAVTVTLSGASSATATTDTNGNYSFAGLSNGSYTVSATKAGYTFSPSSHGVTVNGGNVTGQDFAGTLVTYAISGHVTGASAVTVTLSGSGSGTATTDSGGNYGFSGLTPGSYNVTPSMAGFSFSPPSRVVSVTTSDVTAQDFTATDVLAPTVVTVSPLNLATNVSPTATVTVTFSEAVAGASVTPSSFQLLGNGTPVSGSIVVSGAAVSLTPSAALPGDTVYTVVVKATVTDLAGNALGADFTSTFRTFDNVPPTISAVTPLENAVQVAVDGRATVTFSESVDPASVTSASFAIQGVAGTASVAAAVATFTPTANLDPDMLYTVRVTTAVKDLAGNALAAAKTWSFTTVDTRPPTVLSRTPAPGATGVATSAVLTVTFSEPVAPASVTSSSFGITGVAGTIVVNGVTATFTPNAPLSANTTYTAGVASGVTDLAGNAFAGPATWTFRTVDTVPPTVSSTAPGSGATTVATNASITATFSEDVAPGTVTVSSFTVAPQGGAAIAGSISVAGPTATLQPVAQLTKSTTYVATLTTDVTDLAGNHLAAPYTWSFTTVPNQAPIASAGATQDVSFGQVVTLNGSASSDPDGDPLSYAWTQTAGPTVTLSGATTATPSFTAPSSVATLKFSLTVKDPLNATSTPAPVMVRAWVDASKPVFVDAAGGNDANAGAINSPVQTLGKGITLAAAKGTGAGVYVAGGAYNESPYVGSSIGLYGGFSASNWERTFATTTINGGVTAMYIRANNATLDRFTVNATAATSTGGSSIAVVVASATGVQVTDCVLKAANGFAGLAGSPGASGSAGLAGSNGTTGTATSTSYGVRGLGGAGGSAGVAGWSGGRGGDGGGYTTVWIWGASGNAGSNSINQGSAGGGGGGGGTGYGSGIWCSNLGKNGGVGAWGQNGTAGPNGAAGPAFGSTSTGGYITANAGATGGNGGDGSSGGGGGGSSGVDNPGLWGCATGCTCGTGNGGGGGGGGGRGGAGGTGGRGGGGSFGLVAHASTVTVTGCSITTGSGGAGGAGGAGGSAGAGGLWGTGATLNTSPDLGSGADGGKGGDGAAGGQGGGGAGGPSAGIAYSSSSSVTQSGNTFTLGSAGAGGAPNGLAGIRQSAYVGP